MKQPKSEIREVRKESDELKEFEHPKEKVILIEELPYAEAKSRITDFIQKKKTTDFGEIQDALHLELKTIVKAVKELMAEEKIRERD